MKRFEGKVAIVTGGGSGIGEAAVRRFLEEGACVAISGRGQKRLAEAAADMPQDRILVQPADVSDRAQCERLVATAVEHFGRLDTLVNAAA